MTAPTKPSMEDDPLASAFPGALRELDRLPLAQIEARMRALADVLATARAPEAWMELQSAYHGFMRAALRIRRQLLAQPGLPFDDAPACLVAIAYGFTHASRAVVPPAKLGAAYENVSFKTSDGLTLKGWYVPSKNGAAVVVFPGRTGPQRQVRMLVRHGYGALLFDRRGEAASDGDPNIFGWEFDKDLRGAAAYLRRRPDVEPHRIGGIGLSVGGEALLQTAATQTDDFREGVNAFLEKREPKFTGS